MMVLAGREGREKYDVGGLDAVFGFERREEGEARRLLEKERRV